jgi:hypothetical protein
MGPFYAEEANHQAVVPRKRVRIDVLWLATVAANREEVCRDPARAFVGSSAVAHRTRVDGEAGEPGDHAASVTASAVRGETKPRRSYFARMRSKPARSIFETMRSSPGP